MIRNSLDPLLRAFDFPEPFSAVGRRDVTNVPAQSLALMNNRSIVRDAERWAKTVTQRPGAGPDERSGAESDARLIEGMFWKAFSRSPSPREVRDSEAFLNEGRAIAERRSHAIGELKLAIERQKDDLTGLLEIARTRVTDRRSEVDVGAAGSGVRPQTRSGPLRSSVVAEWDFTESLADAVGDGDVELVGGASRTDSGLVLDAGGYAVSKSFAMDLKEKTLEVWVRLKDLGQRGGGAITVQTPNGATFDSIVFGEQAAREWMAGSNHFARTKSFGGEAEDSADSRFVHLAISYSDDGTITGYRDGKPYGKPYRSDGPISFVSGRWIVSFGVRHLPANPGRLLSGTIAKARVYGVALSAEEIAASANDGSDWISEQELMDALNQSERARLDAMRSELTRLESELTDIPAIVVVGTPANLELSAEEQAWSEFAHALFLLQEFIYVR